MYSSLIGKIEKAKRYAQQPERADIRSLSVVFRGDHDEYRVTYENGTWGCDCSFFTGNGTCSHTMAFQRMIEPTGLHLSTVSSAAVAPH